MPERAVCLFVGWTRVAATRRITGQLMGAGCVSDVDVAAQDRRLEYERGEEQDEEKLHAAVAQHAISQGF
jgi:hypothetical protein